MSKNQPLDECPVPLTDEDVVTAMKAIPGYIDITPADFREVYRLAYERAIIRLRESVIAREVMVIPVTTATPEMSLAHAAELLAVKGISGAPVTDAAGIVVGVISEKDFLLQMGAGQSRSFLAVIAQCLNNKGCLALPIRKQTVKEIMSAPAVTANETTTVAEIASMLTTRNINRLPILGPDGRLSGIVTRRDIVNAYCRIS
ncbi:MAG: CBS domain-containing protein [Thermodesulfobacteriota bacterium]